ncbi:MAG: hypothetical protein GY828_05675 [Candidatus Gracilibacteria bacterium]|nr:hypothetical protein [Candidatus Gracilibacteria bacterium]
MKEVIYIDSFIDLEREYMKKYNSYMIEESILYSFSKIELKEFINATKSEYLKEKLPYSHNLQRQRLKESYKELDEISKYFIDMLEYYFAGGEEIELTKQFLDRLTRFYKVNYEMNSSYKKNLDIQSIPIKEIISMYGKIPSNLRRNIRCILPSHRDKSASLRIYENNNSFYCFGCHKGGNILNLISEIEGITTKEAYKKLLNLYG